MTTTTQSIIDSREIKETNQSIIDNRVRGLHISVCKMLSDNSYDIGHLYKIAKKLSDYDIMAVAEYCSRKSTTPGHAFVSITEKKVRV